MSLLEIVVSDMELPKLFKICPKIAILSSCFMSGSFHLDRASGVECQIFVIVIFFNHGRVLQFGAQVALTQKRSLLVICTTFRFDFHVGRKN